MSWRLCIPIETKQRMPRMADVRITLARSASARQRLMEHMREPVQPRLDAAAFPDLTALTADGNSPRIHLWTLA
jgi:hypothetical protein